jgi:hypothetical protein
MKKLAFIFVFISNISFSQIIKINVSEVVYSYSIDSVAYSLTELLNKQDLPTENLITDVTYEIDLTHKHLNFYKNGVFDLECDLIFTNVDNFYTVYFLIDGYDIRMLINTDPQSEHVIWFATTGTFQEISKFTRFEIVKAF